MRRERQPNGRYGFNICSLGTRQMRHSMRSWALLLDSYANVEFRGSEIQTSGAGIIAAVIAWS